MLELAEKVGEREIIYLQETGHEETDECIFSFRRHLQLPNDGERQDQKINVGNKVLDREGDGEIVDVIDAFGFAVTDQI